MVDVRDSVRRVRKLIVDSFVQSGQAPSAGEIAARLGMARGDVLEDLRALPQIDTFSQEAGTENVRILSPFSNLPTPYRVSVDGERRWYAVCGLEALGIPLMFPGRRVQVDAYCRDCTEPVRLVLRDRTVLECEPAPLVAHLGVPVARWFDDLAFA